MCKKRLRKKSDFTLFEMIKVRVYELGRRNAMSDDYPLTFLYRQYVSGNINARDLEADIFSYILKSCDNKYGLYFKNRSDRIDFLCWFYPRLRAMITRYDDRFASFDTYVSASIRYAYKFHKVRLKKQIVTEKDCWNAFNNGLAVSDCDAGEDADAEDGEEPAKKVRLNSPGNTLLVLLKSYYYVSDKLLRKASRALGIELEVLCGMIDALRILRLKKIERLQKLSNSAHGLYYRCIDYEKQLAGGCEDVYKRDALLRHLERGKRRMAEMRRRIKSMRVEATNSDLAKVLGVPKGTVDTRLASLKHKFSKNELDF
jgi:hypothetical protein